MIKRSIHGRVCEHFEEALNTAIGAIWGFEMASRVNRRVGTLLEVKIAQGV